MDCGVREKLKRMKFREGRKKVIVGSDNKEGKMRRNNFDRWITGSVHICTKDMVYASYIYIYIYIHSFIHSFES